MKLVKEILKKLDLHTERKSGRTIFVSFCRSFSYKLCSFSSFFKEKLNHRPFEENVLSMFEDMTCTQKTKRLDASYIF